LIYLYLRERLPDPTRPPQAHRVRVALPAVFVVFNLPWLVVGQRVLFGGSMWGVGRIPFTGPWIAWQLLGWIYCALVTLYVLAKASVRGSRELGAVLFGARKDAAHRDEPLPAPGPLLSRRRFLARATYAYAGAGVALSTYGIWSAYRLPQVTRRSLVFPDLPPGLDGLKLLHLSDLHAGMHLGEDAMQEIVAQVNALRPDLIVQTGDMIDISRSYIPPYVFHVLLAHRPGAWDTAAPRGIPLTLAGHIHGGQFYLPWIGWSPGSLITKYVMGHFQRGTSQLYVSRGIGVVGVPIRVFTPPEIELFELRRG